MHKSVMQYCATWGSKLEDGLTVLEIGSYDVNGSARTIFQPKSSKYVGCDIEKGKGVNDVVTVEEDLVAKYGEKSFDLVICTEVLEHAENWRKVVHEVKQIAKKYILVTTRSEGFPHHAFPTDCWRYSLDDIKYLFDDYDIQDAQTDSEAPGVMLFALRPKRFIEKDLTKYTLTPAPKP